MPDPVFRPGSARALALAAKNSYNYVPAGYNNADGTPAMNLASPIPTGAALHPYGEGTPRDLAINTPYPRQIPAGYNNPDGTPATIPDPSDPNSPAPPNYQGPNPNQPNPVAGPPPGVPDFAPGPGDSAGREYGRFRQISQRGGPEFRQSNTQELIRRAAARRLGLD